MIDLWRLTVLCPNSLFPHTRRCLNIDSQSCTRSFGRMAVNHSMEVVLKETDNCRCDELWISFEGWTARGRLHKAKRFEGLSSTGKWMSSSKVLNWTTIILTGCRILTNTSFLTNDHTCRQFNFISTVCYCWSSVQREKKTILSKPVNIELLEIAHCRRSRKNFSAYRRNLVRFSLRR